MPLTLFIARRGTAAYRDAMRSPLARLLALVALLLMPLGMASAPANAAPAAQSVAAGHCDDHAPAPDAPIKKPMHCTACAALPAADAPEPSARVLPSAPRWLALSAPINGVEPDIATPPPKRS